MLNYIITEDSLIVVVKGIPESISKSDKRYKSVLDAIKNEKSEEYIDEIINAKSLVEEFSKGNVEVKEGFLYYEGELVEESLTKRFLALLEEGFNVSPFVKFMDNLYKNPSKRATKELYRFLESCNLPITEDGCFLAYKKVRKNYKDLHSGKFDNSIGAKPTMKRNQVDDNPEVSCSTGLHVASYEYAKDFSGSRMMVCKVNPADVVSVPYDYNNSKMRVCSYEVVGEIPRENYELKPNVISNEEIENLEMFSNEEFKEIVRNEDLKSIKEKINKTNFSNNLKDYVYNISNNTYLWRNEILDRIDRESYENRYA